MDGDGDFEGWALRPVGESVARRGRHGPENVRS
jgi:hypothetical protein